MTSDQPIGWDREPSGADMRVICPACGCNLEPVPGAPLGVVACPDCGKRLDLRRHVPADEADAVDPVPAAVRSKSRPARGRPNRWAAPAVVGGIVAATAAVVIVTRPATPPSAEPSPPAVASSAWDVAHRADLLAMKTAADHLAFDGDLRAAYDGYGRLVATAAEHGVTDQVAVQIVTAARAGQDRVFAALMGRGTPPPPDAVAATPTPTPERAFPQVTMPFADRPSAPPSPTTGPAPTAADANPADVAPAVAHPPPPPQLHAYTPADAVTDAEIGEAIDKGIGYLRGQFRNGEITTGQRDRPQVAAAPKPAQPAKPAADDGDLAGGSGLDATGPGSGGSALDPALVGPNGRGRFGRSGGDDYRAGYDAAFSTPGIDALCVYALLHAGEATRNAGLGVADPFTTAALDRLKAYRLLFTYHRSLRAAALAVFDRPQDRAALEDDVGWLVDAQREGGYTYVMPQPQTSTVNFDNSNSQYGLLGVWAGAQAGISVPDPYWRAVGYHWTRTADPRGVWGYSGPGGPTLTMTCAGIASLLVSGDYLDDAGLAAQASDRPSANPLADAGLARLDEGDNAVASLFGNNRNSPVGGAGYGLYGLERVGLASGFKYFGDHDWYAELAKRLVGAQAADGSWRGGDLSQTEIDTAYCLLFLARGRHPILFNKLRYPGHWNDRPHDVAHVARFAAAKLERPLNWQVVNLRRTWSDWMDAPVLYVSGDAPPPLADGDLAALRDYALAGGTIFTHADGGSPAFNAWVAQLVRRLFPKYELSHVHTDDPLNTVLFRLKNPPPFQTVTNGSRILLIHSPTDIAGGWHLNWTDAKAGDFQAGLNVFVQAAGKTNYKNRQASTYIPPPPAEPEAVRPVARLRFAGEWDPEPYAWTRFARYFQWETRLGLDVRTVDLKSLQPGQVPIAVLTGTVRQDFTAAETAAARAFVDAGGVLLVDACGGQAAFDKSVRTTLLPAAFPDGRLAAVGPDHPLRVPARPFADDLRGRLPLRPFAAERLAAGTAPLLGFRSGRGWVIYSPLDLTTGLLGTESWGIDGYDPAYAQAIVKNAVLWATARAAGPPVSDH